jgi:hypothetical protein
MLLFVFTDSTVFNDVVLFLLFLTVKDVSDVIDHGSRFVNVLVVLNQNTGHFVHHISKINNFFLDNSD